MDKCLEIYKADPDRKLLEGKVLTNGGGYTLERDTEFFSSVFNILQYCELYKCALSWDVTVEDCLAIEPFTIVDSDLKPISFNSFVNKDLYHNYSGEEKQNEDIVKEMNMGAFLSILRAKNYDISATSPIEPEHL